MFQQESIPVKATTSTLKEDTPTEEVVVTESVVKQKDTAATTINLREQLRELEVERVEESDKELGRGAYGEDEDYADPKYLLREKIYFPKEETRQAKKRLWKKTWKKRFQKLVKVSS